ncbi:glycosyltransferase [Actinomycetospora cinnamomea]|uniref:Glycosyl transferase family 1 n=1 Tax=Actinomycetospora cinnamomea TaxID=663609 RepID=A0A2U1EAV3_9PSEU|nr:glycosyltransferase [Actinomycetospora cinnamomea]PVY97078.1 glycosyl transferase family 1 [Actinomycetospora cinnamomea]
MQSLRIVPDLRSSVVEEKPASQALLFTSQRDDAEAALLEDPSVRPFTWSRLVDAARDPDLELLEVAEPLWLGEWVRAVRYVLLVRVLRALRPGRGPVTVATYAIENLDARERLSFRALETRPVLSAVASRLAVLGLGLSVLLLDAVVFGTTGAAENYRRSFGWALRRTRHTVLTPRVSACTVCGPTVVEGARDRTVLFLGAPSERKGFPVLMEAWERSGAAVRGWQLVVADPNGPADRPVAAGVAIRVGMPRSEVHGLLRTGAVVALPSVRRPGWREQIGLPLVEGLAHGCRVVTTTETGLADDLRGHPLVVVTAPGDPESLADGLRRAMEPGDGVAGPAAAGPGCEGSTKRDVVAWWLSGGPGGPRSR